MNLQWLFTATFVVMLVAIPFYGGLCGNGCPARRFVPWVYAFFIANLAGVAALLHRATPDNVGWRACSTSGSRCSTCLWCRWRGA